MPIAKHAVSSCPSVATTTNSVLSFDPKALSESANAEHTTITSGTELKNPVN